MRDVTDKITAPSSSSTRERVICWVTDLLAVLYLLWIAAYLVRSTGHFAQMYEGLGARLPASTQFLVDQRVWFYPAVFGGLAVLVLAKEAALRDKRVSSMITFLLALLGQFMAHWLTSVYYLPLFGLIRQLSGP